MLTVRQILNLRQTVQMERRMTKRHQKRVRRTIVRVNQRKERKQTRRLRRITLLDGY